METETNAYAALGLRFEDAPDERAVKQVRARATARERRARDGEARRSRGWETRPSMDD